MKPVTEQQLLCLQEVLTDRHESLSEELERAVRREITIRGELERLESMLRAVNALQQEAETLQKLQGMPDPSSLIV